MLIWTLSEKVLKFVNDSLRCKRSCTRKESRLLVVRKLDRKRKRKQKQKSKKKRERKSKKKRKHRRGHWLAKTEMGVVKPDWGKSPVVRTEKRATEVTQASGEYFCWRFLVDSINVYICNY